MKFGLSSCLFLFHFMAFCLSNKTHQLYIWSSSIIPSLFPVFQTTFRSCRQTQLLTSECESIFQIQRMLNLLKKTKEEEKE